MFKSELDMEWIRGNNGILFASGLYSGVGLLAGKIDGCHCFVSTHEHSVDLQRNSAEYFTSGRPTVKERCDESRDCSRDRLVHDKYVEVERVALYSPPPRC